jgi:hypothetical protein
MLKLKTLELVDTLGPPWLKKNDFLLIIFMDTLSQINVIQKSLKRQLHLYLVGLGL